MHTDNNCFRHLYDQFSGPQIMQTTRFSRFFNLFRIIDFTDVARRSKLVPMKRLSLQGTPGGKAQLRPETPYAEYLMPPFYLPLPSLPLEVTV